MRNINKDCSISEYPGQLVIASKLISIVNQIVEAGKALIARKKKASADARLNVYYKNRMKKQKHQNTINQMPLEMKLRMGFHRS